MNHYDIKSASKYSRDTLARIIGDSLAKDLMRDSFQTYFVTLEGDQYLVGSTVINFLARTNESFRDTMPTNQRYMHPLALAQQLETRLEAMHSSDGLIDEVQYSDSYTDFGVDLALVHKLDLPRRVDHSWINGSKDDKRLFEGYHLSGGHTDYRDRIFEKHLTIVKGVLKRLAPQASDHHIYDRKGLMDVGKSTLYELIETYDCTRNIQFITYTYPRIRGAMIDHLRSLDFVPRSLRTTANRIKRYVGANHMDLWYDGDEIMKALDLTEEAFTEASRILYGKQILSFEDPIRDTENLKVKDTLSVEPRNMSDDPIWISQVAEDLAASLETLPDQERFVFESYYIYENSLREIGDYLGLTESRACQLLTKAKQRLSRISELQEHAKFLD